jgi:hypothetical protein
MEIIVLDMLRREGDKNKYQRENILSGRKAKFG